MSMPRISKRSFEEAEGENYILYVRQPGKRVRTGECSYLRDIDINSTGCRSGYTATYDSYDRPVVENWTFLRLATSFGFLASSRTSGTVSFPRSRLPCIIAIYVLQALDK